MKGFPTFAPNWLLLGSLFPTLRTLSSGFSPLNASFFDRILSSDRTVERELSNQYREGIRALVAQGKPVAITEFGCTTFRGASDKSGSGGMIVEYENNGPVRLNGDYLRDEAEQATHLRELLDIFTAEGVDTAFVNTFASYHLPHRDPHLDLDMASYGVVKVLEDRLGHAIPTWPGNPRPRLPLSPTSTMADRIRTGMLKRPCSFKANEGSCLPPQQRNPSVYRSRNQ